MLLTKIETSGDGARFILHFENGARLRCGPRELSEHALRAGAALSEEAYARLERACEAYRVRAKAAALAAARAMSAGELVRKLREKGASEEDARAAAAQLQDLGIVDEAEYARQIVRHYAARGYGPRRVESELFRRQIPRELWSPALDAMPEADETLDRLIAARLRGRAPSKEALRKLAAALGRRGYSWAEIRRALDRLGELPEEAQDAEDEA